jgi:hypothetical protein
MIHVPGLSAWPPSRLQAFHGWPSKEYIAMHDIRPGRRAAFAACAGAFLLALAAMAATGALAQMQRPFPPDALRGTVAFGQTPEIALNGRAARLSAGSRIRGQDNLIVLPASLMGRQLAVHYTLDFNGDVKDVWILTPEELAKRPWPTTPEEAARWAFDPATQTWTRQ